jgi:tRNA threonylcarbamoyladenosine biosynthesis protein TsaE
MDRIQHIKLEQARAVAARTAKTLKGGEILALIGPLGSGKTTFTKALGQALKIRHKITSPTFTLMHVFPLRLPGKAAALYHLDLYRTKNFREVKALGITETWGKADTITVIEWADKIKRHLPKKTRLLYFSHT